MNAAAGLTIEEMRCRVGVIDYQSRLYYSDRETARGAVLIAPPHPFLGGNFDNNVVVHLAQAFASRGWVALTYNLPGVGATPARPGAAPSREDFWESPDLGIEIDADRDDYLALSRQLIEIARAPGDRLIAAGYSYGAAVAILAACGRAAGLLISISPPLPRIPLSPLLSVPCPSLHLFAEDDLALGDEGENLLETIKAPSMNIERIAGADHFYLDRLEAISHHVFRFIETNS